MYLTYMNRKIDKLAVSARVGKQIAHYRNLANFTQRELAAQLGITQALLACYETGKRNIPIGILEPCAEVLGGNISMFFVESDEDAASPRKPGPRSKLDRQIEQLRKLPSGQQQLVSDVINTVLQAAESRT